MAFRQVYTLQWPRAGVPTGAQNSLNHRFHIKKQIIARDELTFCLFCKIFVFCLFFSPHLFHSTSSWPGCTSSFGFGTFVWTCASLQLPCSDWGTGTVAVCSALCARRGAAPPPDTEPPKQSLVDQRRKSETGPACLAEDRLVNRKGENRSIHNSNGEQKQGLRTKAGQWV